ncbi:CBP4-domain-containing protein [Lojkania enalia]|uniref:Cytochrome b mRNA-processing protein 4 n=1 Tax=Lojkania enalia TaxID=147567 RepID=A0A9P4K7A9_9PLEO|nr:CBP4-domain-containing protein [Didymosphaeria enalia]
MPTARIVTYTKALAAGAALCIGGPALVWYVTPTEEEIFKKYNPDLQKRALETRDQRQQEFDDFVCRLKEASKSPKPIWKALEEMDKADTNAKAQRLRDEQATLMSETERRRAEIRASLK